MLIRSIAITILLFHSANSLAAMDHNAEKKSADICSDPSQPAQLKCAPAPSAEFDTKGRLWVAWSYAGHVYVSRSDDKGKSFNPPVVVNKIPEAISARGENRPKIAVNESGRIHVSWTMPLKKRFTGHVRFSYSDDGKHFSEPVIVNDNLDITGHRFDALGVNRNGDVYLAWLDKRDRYQAAQKKEKYHGAAVYYALSEDGGKTFKPNKKIIDHSCECCRVIIDFDKNDLPVILWRNIYGKDVRDHTLVSFLSKDQPGEPVRVSYDEWHIDACPHHGPDMSIDDTDNTHLVWFNNAPERHGLFYARYNQKDNSFTKAVNFGNYKATASHPNVMSHAEQVWLVWKEFDGKQESIWLQHSTNQGSNWNAAQKIAVTASAADYPFLIKDRDVVYLQWQTQADGYQLIEVSR